ncbi:hypothetical protein NDU88_002831 [Pleurodeles waltl]|uniref:Uncharacterized protein n=1 Tax=Pleurodeles waltl TaxID=8319 RepID=A0AAV7QB11_PLEWA|nr:hypothetical protein NDU88_002831 [Pleurodeles waltl]
MGMLSDVTGVEFRTGDLKLMTDYTAAAEEAEKDAGSLPMENMPRDDLAPDVGFARTDSLGPTSSADFLEQIAASVIKDHKYNPFTSLEAAGSLPRLHTNTLDATESDSSHSSKWEPTDDPKPSGKRKRKSRNIEEQNQTQNTLSFDPEAICDLPNGFPARKWGALCAGQNP